jgi:oxygen-independent coproporphyrinogen III oxidase
MHALPALDCELPVLDTELLKRYDRPGPRYTSYPAAPQFTTAFGAAELHEHAARSNQRPGGPRPLSLYVHVPFCFSPCFYCGCNRLITRDTTQGVHYVQRLRREIALTAPLFGPEREVVQLHLGGGTPNFLRPEPLEWLIDALGESFRLSRAAARDFSIELDPRTVPAEYPPLLARLGFNRVSLGVQDFDPEVQGAVNRIQSTDETLDLIDACRDSGFRSVNVDLIYGLPRQTPAAFRRTLRMVMSARPDRLAVYGYAHLPGLFKAQRQIDASAVPGAEQRLELLRLALEELAAGGHRYIGMDHFALPDDELVRAQEAGGLQRNFMGYTTHADCELLGLGVSAISHIGESFCQNFRDLKNWDAALAARRLPVWRGLALSADDRVRGAVISQLMCQGVIDIDAIEERYDLDFARYFAEALAQLTPHLADGLVCLADRRLIVTPAGRMLLRSIAMCFDAYLNVAPPAAAPRPCFSRVI